MRLLNGETDAGPRSVDRLPPHLFFLGSAVFHYLGPSFAVLLFAIVPVGGVAWLRIVSAALVLAAWRRPWRAFRAVPPQTRWTIMAPGAVFAAMNYSFYLAIDQLPLGTVAAIEFIGPIVLALTGSRTARNLAALLIAAGGVYVLTDVRLTGEPAGFAWAFPTPGCSRSTSSWPIAWPEPTSPPAPSTGSVVRCSSPVSSSPRSG